MTTDSITSYLERLFFIAKESLSHDYNLSTLNFDSIEYINTFTIHQAIERNLNLHIRTCNKKENENLYLPTIISVAILGFIKNYVAYNPTPIVGEIIQKDKKRYTVSKVVNGSITIVNKAEGNLRSDIPLSSYRKYIVTTAEKETDGRKLKTGFDHYRNFFETIVNGGIGNAMPSKFCHKYLIVTSKELLDALRKEKSGEFNIYKSLPIRYITSRGVIADNIPIDPMIYIVNDYETAKEFVIREQNIETIVVIGDSKYREHSRNIAQDIRASRINNAIFIGSEAIDNFENLHRWNWTKLEQDALSKQSYYRSQQHIVTNSNISTKITELQLIIEDIEKQYNISITRYFSDYIRKVSRIVIPRVDSRLNNKLLILKEEFRKAVLETIESALYDKGIYSSKEVQDRLTTAFNSVTNCVRCQKWNLFETLKEVDYIVVPKDYIDELKSILRGNTKTRPIRYSELSKIKGECPKVCFFSVYGKQHFDDCYLSDSFKSIFILYPHEDMYFRYMQSQYSERIKQELSSDDRFKLSGIRYSTTMQNESIDEMILRLFAGQDEDHNQESYKQDRSEESHIICHIIFDDGECEDVESSKSVLLCNTDLTEIVAAEKLRTGDLVRIYANVNKERLWHIASSSDTKGLFKSIDDASKLWKQYLLDYQIDNNLDLESLFRRLISNGLRGVKNSSTIERWLNMDSDTKFPKEKRNIYVIKNTINNPCFDSKYQDIISKRRAYFSIMIGLGRDLSDEIIRYIQSKGKNVGEILSKYDDSVREGFAGTNAPIRKITSITYIQDEAGE